MKRLFLIEHFQHRARRPLPLDLIYVCEEAISFVEQGMLEQRVTLPSGKKMKAERVVEKYGLGRFVN